MDIEFHYHITYILAKKTDFSPDESYILAYSSQYVDDNTMHYYVNFTDGSNYLSEVSQTMDIIKPSSLREKIYPVFHFIPGDPESPTARRKDGRTHPCNTTPNSENARDILANAFESRDLYRIGVAIHSYADTWAHQNFVGFTDRFNAMKGYELLPNIGHADARHEPDKVDNRWKDGRLADGVEIANNERFIEAAKHIFSAFWKHRGKPDDGVEAAWAGLEPSLVEAMKKTAFLSADHPARIKAYGEICPQIPEYDAKAWRHEAVDKKELETDIFDRYWAKGDFKAKNWYKFQEAVKANREYTLNKLRPLFEKEKLSV